ncbi:MAG: hypothetical protein KOO60_01910 [Gemmatimonadales bacterium]|nr:hypothetical protein [Gemmatimonadales bacterium]
MKRITIVLAIMLMAGVANAGPIYDMEVGGLYAEGDYVEVVCATVTAVTEYGCAIAEVPFGMGNSTWVYLGSGHTTLVGDIVTVNAPYTEYYDLTELDVGHNTVDPGVATFVTVGVCTEMPAPIFITAAEIMAAPEHYESCMVWITDGFHVTELLTYGEWSADSHEDGTQIRFDDYWFDETVLAVADCANWAVGMWTYAYSNFKLHPTVDGFPAVQCAVASDETSLDAIKALYR